MNSQQNSFTAQSGKFSSVRSSAPAMEGTERTSHYPIRVVRWLFYAFVFSLPFETAFEGWLEPTTILGAVLLSTTLLQPRVFLRWPPKGYLCFLVYLYIVAALSFLEPSQYRSLSMQSLFLLAQLTALGWIAYCVMRERHVAERALLTFGFACTLLALLQVTGVAGRPVEVHASVVRMTALGFHPNNLARILMLGLLALIGLTFGRSSSFLKPVFVTFPFFALVGAALIQTGSRGALIALTIGLMTLVLRRGTPLMKVLNALAMLMVIGFIFAVALQSDVMRARFEETIEEGDLARRELIYPTAWQMFQEKPLIGWGPITSTYELGGRLSHPEEETKNPHNLILYGLVATGLLGSFPLFIGIALAAFSAWKSRHGPHGILPLAMVAAVLVANMSGLWLFNKLHWMIMAYAMASVSYAPIKEYALSATRPKRVNVNAEGYVSV